MNHDTRAPGEAQNQNQQSCFGCREKKFLAGYFDLCHLAAAMRGAKANIWELDVTSYAADRTAPDWCPKLQAGKTGEARG